MNATITPGDSIEDVIAIIKREAKFNDLSLKQQIIKFLDALNSDLIKGEYDMPKKTKNIYDELLEYMSDLREQAEVKEVKQNPRPPLLPIDDDED
jgi:cell fate regulator YaaT (PSP1 superfamily)